MIKKIRVFEGVMVSLVICGYLGFTQPAMAVMGKEQDILVQQGAEAPWAVGLTEEEIQGIQVLASACIHASPGTMKEHLVDRKMLESDDLESELLMQTQFVLSVYNDKYAAEARKQLTNVAEMIDEEYMFLSQEQLYRLLEMAGAEPSEELKSYDYLMQWYEEGYYKIDKFYSNGEIYQEIDFKKIEKLGDGRVLVKAILRLEDIYGAVEAFEIILSPNPESVFGFSVDIVRSELVQPEGTGIIGTDHLLQTPYVRPDHMTDNPFDYIFQLDGAFYQMPFPAEELEHYGWKIEEQGSLEAGGRKEVHVRKNDTVLTIGLWNYNTVSSELKDCRVVWMKTGHDNEWSTVNFKLAEGIENGQEIEEVEPVYHDYLKYYTHYGRRDPLYRNIYGYDLHFENDVVKGFEMGYAPTPLERQKRIHMMTESWGQDPKTEPHPGMGFEMELNHIYLVDVDGDGIKEEICLKELGGIQWAGSRCIFIDGEMNCVVKGAVADKLYGKDMKMVVEDGKYYFYFKGWDYANDVFRKIRIENGWSKDMEYDLES